MRRSQRLISAAVLLALASALTGCGSTGGGFEPSDLLDWMDTKKKLPGTRKPVFPEGVPGVQQGVPRELYKGADQQPVQQEAMPPVAAEAAPTRGSRNRSAVRQAAPAEEAAAPAPKPKKPVRRRTTAPPADNAEQQSAPEPVQQSAPAPAPVQQAAPPRPAQPATSAFPAPLPSGSFQR